ncbi:glycosyltransferase [Microbacterium pumilum]|uniref:Glycosyl transferase n=1 Tax=Microbacterium pumilum TaxID=344165 RepID=A0ABP5ECG4_9MICO
MTRPESNVTSAAAPSFSHLLALSDEHGVFEHALLDAPRREHGYCVDDVARAIGVLLREPDPAPELVVLMRTCLRFVEQAVDPDGRAHNRMADGGGWTDEPALGDWWGRAVQALGLAAVRAPTEQLRYQALAAFHRAALARSPHGRAMAFATLGAAEVLINDPHDLAARALVLDGMATIATPHVDSWEWPEPRLRYANAVLPEALLAGGSATDNPRIIARGLLMLRFLVHIETARGHLSVAGVAGRGPAQRSAQFDQQPIEVAALADASARAFEITQDSEWRDVVAIAWAWFTGDNDASTPMFDHVSGAGFDGLHEHGRNGNRGAESTLAALSTYQHARRLEVLELVAS